MILSLDMCNKTISTNDENMQTWFDPVWDT